MADGDGLHLHFFEVAPRPFNILEFFKDVFTLESGRVTAVRPVKKAPCFASGTCSGGAGVSTKNEVAVEPDCCSSGTCAASMASRMPPDPSDPLPPAAASGSKTVRSTLVCTQICCSSEVPIINKMMEPIEGVSKTMINVPLKQVTVDHDPSVITAKDIENVLNKNRFGATLKRDGGAGAAAGGSDGRSHFYVEKICCASEIPAINSILNPIDGVSNVSINVTTKMVRTRCYNV